MLNVGVVGLGNTGNQIVAKAKEELNIPVLAINSSEKDLSTIPSDVPKRLISDSEGKSKGAGKNRKLAKTYLRDSIQKLLTDEEVKNFILDLDVLYVVSSVGGGTGSGTSLIFASIVKQMFDKDLIVVPIGVGPVDSEALSSHVNSLEYLNELYTQLGNNPYMLYDNNRYADLPSYQMMDKINSEIVHDINVLRGYYNMATKYDSIDDEDLKRIISIGKRIMVVSLKDIKEKDIDSQTIEDKLIDAIKNSCHVEMQRDKKVSATGIITNMSEEMTHQFNNHIPKVREFIGDPIHDFNHIYTNPDRKLPNNVFLIMSGLSPVNDKIHKINDRIQEIEEHQKIMEDDNALDDVDMDALQSKINQDVETTASEETQVNISGIFANFGLD